MPRTVSLGWLVSVAFLMLATVPPLEHYLRNPDSGFQLSLGWLAIAGDFPFVDMLQHYGPLVTFTSAAGLAIHPSVLPEVILCSLGYALAIYCLFDLFKTITPNRHLAIAAGLAVSLAGWVLRAKFYKWYYWLFQLLTLAVLARAAAKGPGSKRWALAAGLIAGIGFLYRHDLGTACFLTSAATLGMQMWAARQDRRWWHGLGWLTSGFVLPVLAWLAVLSAVGGEAGCRGYLSTLWIGSARTARHWSMPLPRWDMQSPFSPDSCRFLIFALMGLCYTVALVWGATAMLRKRPCNPYDAALAAGGLLGVLISPQGLFRPDVHHLLQAIPPFLAVAGILLVRLVSRCWSAPPVGWRRVAGVVATGACVAAISLLFWQQRRDMGQTWGPGVLASVGRYRDLGRGLDAADPTIPVVQVARFIRSRTSADARILVTPILPQLYYWAARPMSGMVNAYAGIFATDFWRAGNLDAVRRRPPALLVVDRGFLASDPQTLFVLHNPELHAWLKTHYPRVVFETPELVVCAPQ
jgi:hypothetical protein